MHNEQLNRQHKLVYPYIFQKVHAHLGGGGGWNGVSFLTKYLLYEVYSLEEALVTVY